MLDKKVSSFSGAISNSKQIPRLSFGFGLINT